MFTFGAHLTKRLQLETQETHTFRCGVIFKPEKINFMCRYLSILVLGIGILAGWAQPCLLSPCPQRRPVCKYQHSWVNSFSTITKNVKLNPLRKVPEPKSFWLNVNCLLAERGNQSPLSSFIYITGRHLGWREELSGWRKHQQLWNIVYQSTV